MPTSTAPDSNVSQNKDRLWRGGSNTLFWLSVYFAGKKAKHPIKLQSSIILMRYALKEKVLRTKPKLLQIPDEDTVFNPTLIEFLKKNLKLIFRSMKNSCPKTIAESMLKALANGWEKIQGTHGFEVVEELFLSNFSFAKYLMEGPAWSTRTITLFNFSWSSNWKASGRLPYSVNFIKPNEIDTKVHASELFAPLNRQFPITNRGIN